MQITAYDSVFLIIIASSLIFAMVRGGVSEMLSIGSWFGAFFLLKLFGNNLEQHLTAIISNQFLRLCVAFIIIFIILAIITALLKKMCAQVVEKLGLKTLDILLGAVFGFMRGFIICALLILFIEAFKLDNNHLWYQSHFAFIVTPISQWLLKSIAHLL